ncbi:hypothetical protein DJ72_05190, partial [Halorubrum distributum]
MDCSRTGRESNEAPQRHYRPRRDRGRRRSDRHGRVRHGERRAGRDGRARGRRELAAVAHPARR